MKVTRNVGMLLLGIWLALTGLVPLLNLGFQDWELSWRSSLSPPAVLIVVGR